MSTPTAVETRTLGEIAFGGRPDARTIRAKLETSGTAEDVRRANAALWSVARTQVLDELAKAAQQLLGATALEVLSAGYRVNVKLVEAARASVATPGRVLPVPLAGHTVTVTDIVELDVRVAQLHATIHLGVDVRFEVDPLVATVRNGKLISVGDGTADVTIAIIIDGKPVLVRRAELRVNVRRTFDPAIVLLSHE